MAQESEWRKFEQCMRPGDHIFCKRKEGKYHHHGIYMESMGKSMVIHLRRKSSVCDDCDECRYIPPLRCGRILSCLGCFSANEVCYIIRYRKVKPLENLNEELRKRLRPGKAIRGYHSKQMYLELFLDSELYCHVRISKKRSCKYTLEDRFELSRFSTSKSADEVMKTAVEDGWGFKRYNLLMNNCEDFAVFCKTDKGASVQVQKCFTKILPLGIGRSGYNAAKCIYRFCIRRDIQRKLHEWLQNYSSTETELDQPSRRHEDFRWSVEIEDEEGLLLDGEKVPIYKEIHHLYLLICCILVRQWFILFCFWHKSCSCNTTKNSYTFI